MASGSNAKRGRGNDALNEQLKKFMEDMTAAADMWRTSSREMSQVADDMARGTGGGFGPRGGDNQTRRPSHYSGGYPGAHGGQLHGGGALGQLRQMAAQRINDKYGGNFKVSQRDPVTGKPTHYHQYDAAGNKMPNIDGGDEYEAAHVQRALTGSRIAGGLAEGGVLGAARAVPYVGVALTAAEAVYKGAKFIGDQRAANAQYQSIYGGSNMQGMGQRFLQQGFKLNQLFTGGLTGRQSDEAFQGVSALGYQGGTRQQALNFVQGNYKSMGMDVKESMSLIQIASRGLTTSLSDLRTELKQVTETAKETGQNAAVLRAAFIQNFASVTQAGGQGGSGAVAGAMSTLAGPGAGRQYAQSNTLGLDSTSSLMMQANQLGMPLGRYIAENAKDYGKTYAKGRQKLLNFAVNSAGGGPQVMAAIKKAIADAGGAEKVAAPGPDGEGLQTRIANQLMDAGILNPLAVGTILRSYGIDVSQEPLPVQAAHLIRLVAQGDRSIIDKVDQAHKDARRTQMSDADVQTMLDSTASGDANTGVSYATNAVQDYEIKNKVRDPALEAVYGVVGTKKGRLTVKDKNGKDVDVSFKDALKNPDYVKQIDNGTAIFKNVSDKTFEGRSVLDKGMANVGDMTQGGGGDTTRVGGITVTVTGSEQLRKLLGINIQTDPATQGGADNNTPPTPTGKAG